MPPPFVDVHQSKPAYPGALQDTVVLADVAPFGTMTGFEVAVIRGAAPATPVIVTESRTGLELLVGVSINLVLPFTGTYGHIRLFALTPKQSQKVGAPPFWLYQMQPRPALCVV